MRTIIGSTASTILIITFFAIFTAVLFTLKMSWSTKLIINSSREEYLYIIVHLYYYNFIAGVCLLLLWSRRSHRTRQALQTNCTISISLLNIFLSQPPVKVAFSQHVTLWFIYTYCKPYLIIIFAFLLLNILFKIPRRIYCIYGTASFMAENIFVP